MDDSELSTIMNGDKQSDSLEDLFPQDNRESNGVPSNAASNMAGSLAMLDGGSDMENTYYRTKEGMQQGDLTDYQYLQDKVNATQRGKDYQSVLQAMGDNTIPPEKRAAMYNNFMAQTRKDADSRMAIGEQNLINSSQGETAVSGDARINTAEVFAKYSKAASEYQNVANKIVTDATPKNISAGLVAEGAGALLTPGSTSAQASNMADAISQALDGTNASVWDHIKAAILPGQQVANLRERLANIPADRRVEFAKELAQQIQQNSGIIFKDQNQAVQFFQTQKIFSSGGYDSFDQFMDNVTPLLDLIGVGSGVNTVRKMVKGGKAVGDAANAAKTSSEASEGVQATTTATNAVQAATQAPKASNREQLIARYQQELADMGGTEESNLSKGQVRDLNAARKQHVQSLKADALDIDSTTKQYQSQGMKFKDARKQALADESDRQAELTHRISNIDAQLAQNSEAAEAAKRVADINKEIRILQKKPLTTSQEMEDAVERMRMLGLTHVENTMSQASIAHNTNPEAAATIHKSVLNSQGEEAANALYGQDTVGALAGDITPQATTNAGYVFSKANVTASSVEEAVNAALDGTRGAIYTSGEQNAITQTVKRDFSDVTGLEMNPAMSSFSLDGDRMRVSGVYSLKGGNFDTPRQAIEQAKVALRDYGVTDSDIQLLKKDGVNHRPVNLEDALDTPGDYVVKIDLDHTVTPRDVPEWDNMSTVFNWLDSMPIFAGKTQGSAARHVMDAASMLDPRLTKAGTSSVDQVSHVEKVLFDLAKQFSDKYVKLKKERKSKLDTYFKEANRDEIPYSRADMLGKGFTEGEADVAQHWRNFWDTIYDLENRDVVHSLNSQGYKLFTDKSATQLFVKPLGKNKNIRKVYDTQAGKVVDMFEKDWDDLYAKGGTNNKLRTPMTVDGQEVEHAITHNTASNYARGFKNSDRVLNYREGYYRVTYKTRKFLEEVQETDNTGRVIKSRTVLPIRDTPSGKHIMETMQKNNPDKTYRIRDDNKEIQLGEDAWWDLQSTSGRVNQRHRGDLLEDVSKEYHDYMDSYVQNPAESAIKAAKSTAGRTIMKPMLDAAKQRAINQFGAVFPKVDGMPVFPADATQIVDNQGAFTKLARDARTNVEYINFLEKGYVNAMDETWKQLFIKLGDTLGDTGLGAAQRGAYKASEVKPTGTAKGAVFTAYIAASNPVRQLIMQPHQAIRMFAYNPTGWFTGRNMKLITQALLEKKGATGDVAEFQRALESSGILQAISKSNLVRDTILEVANDQSRAVRVIKSPLTLMRKIGYDTGEAVNLLMHAASVFDRMKQTGKGVKTSQDIADFQSTVRALSYDMNRAGDMPYNLNSLAMLFQFMQIPHKAILQVSNRRIPVADRLKLFATDMSLWGAPIVGGAMTFMGFENGTGDEKVDKILRTNLESYLMNEGINALTGIDSDTDYTALSPYNLDGWTKMFVEGLIGGGVGSIITSSPAGQLLFKDGGRGREAISTIARYFSGFDDDIPDTATFTSVLNSVASISSGWNSANRAYLAYKLGSIQDKIGKTVDGHVTTPEAIAMAFGFGTQDEVNYYKTSQYTYTASKQFEDDVRKNVRDVMKFYKNQLANGAKDNQYMTKVSSVALHMYKDNPKAQQIVAAELRSLITGGEASTFKQLLNIANIPSITDVEGQVNASSLPPDQKQIIIQRMRDVQQASKMIKEEGNNK